MLTIRDILILNALVYTKDFAINNELENKSVYDWAKQFQYARDLNDEIPGGIREDQFDKIVFTVKKYAKMYRNIQILDIDNHEYGDEAGRFPIVQATFLYRKQLIIVFKGTAGPLEWRDNGEGAYHETIHTSQQESAIDYYDRIVNQYKKLFNTIFLVGHSKGGNKAQFITVLRGQDKRLKHCYSIDGPGFNQTFIHKYANEIKQYNRKMTSISNMFDFVNILLFPIIENRIFLQSNTIVRDLPSTIEQVKGRFGGWHSIGSLFSDEYEVKLNPVTHQSKLMKSIEQLLQHYLKTLNAEDTRYLYYQFASLMMKTEIKQHGEIYSKMPKSFYKRLYLAHQSYQNREDTYNVDEILSFLKPIIGEIFNIFILKDVRKIKQFDQDIQYYALDDISEQRIYLSWFEKFIQKIK